MKPLGVHHIVLRRLQLSGALSFRNLLDGLRWDASVQPTWLTDRSLQDNRPRRNDAPLSNNRVVHHNSAHANQNAISHRAAVNDGVVANADVVADACGRFFVGAVNAGPVLDVRPGSNRDGVHIPTNDSIKPHSALFAEGDFPNHG